MRHAATFYLLTDDEPTALPELATVALVRDVAMDEGRVLSAGSHGTIVGVWGGGTAYDVEFLTPFPALVTVEVEAIRPDARPHR